MLSLGGKKYVPNAKRPPHTHAHIHIPDQHRQVLSRREVEEAFLDAHNELDRLAQKSIAGPVGTAVREMEARTAAASSAVGGLTYSEFYRLLAAVPMPVPFGTAASAADTCVTNGVSVAAGTVEGEMDALETDTSAKTQGFCVSATGGDVGDAPRQQRQQPQPSSVPAVAAVVSRPAVV